jgi:hypothetical protein
MSSTSSTVLTDPNYVVPSAPDPGAGGVAWLRASVVRFSSGETHRRRRAMVVAELAAVDPEALRAMAAGGAAGPVEVLAVALGLPADVADDVAVVAESYHPHTAVTDEADLAVDRLVVACGGVADEATANRIALLVQACAATKALVENGIADRTDPPVPVTRRVAPDGTVVLVDLTDAPFGLGPHACPGRAHAEAIADGLVARSTR